jgi:two-component system cell cycle response regulator
MAQQLKDKSLSDLVYKDDLTSLHNRRYLRRYLSGALGSPKEQKVHSLLWLDVDHFKRINDTQGHKCGDQVLIHVAEALRTSFRDSDTVVRYAGDEFVVVLPDTEKRVATTLADRMRRHILDSPFVYDRNQPPLIISVSAGVASFPADAKTVDELLEQADRALYQT